MAEEIGGGGGHRRERDGDHRARARPAESSAKGAEKTREGRRGGDRIESQRGLEGDAADGRVERGAIGVAAPPRHRVALSKRDGTRVVVAAGVRTRAVSARGYELRGALEGDASQVRGVRVRGVHLARQVELMAHLGEATHAARVFGGGPGGCGRGRAGDGDARGERAAAAPDARVIEGLALLQVASILPRDAQAVVLLRRFGRVVVVAVGGAPLVRGDQSRERARGGPRARARGHPQRGVSARQTLRDEVSE